MTAFEKNRLSAITCSDRRMDIVDTNYLLDTPINTYNIKCASCKFPDIDTIPNPYYLAKNRIFSGVEIMEADLGNLLISIRLKKIFEILFPGTCVFKKTFIQTTKISTNWWLAIPNRTIISGEADETVLRCKKCNQPLYAHPGSQYKFWIHDFEGEYDIVKSENWFSTDDKDWKKSWIGRDVFLSVRLISLLKKISAKGIYQQLGSKYKGLTKSEKQWVEEALNKIDSLGINIIKKEVTSDELNKLRLFLKIEELNTDNISLFEKKFNCQASDIVKILCSITEPILINAEINNEYKILGIKDWELLKSSKNLINFAFDDFGNSLQFDLKDKVCPIYHYDHETMTSELTHSCIIEMIL